MVLSDGYGSYGGPSMFHSHHVVPTGYEINGHTNELSKLERITAQAPVGASAVYGSGYSATTHVAAAPQYTQPTPTHNSSQNQKKAPATPSPAIGKSAVGTSSSGGGFTSVLPRVNCAPAANNALVEREAWRTQRFGQMVEAVYSAAGDLDEEESENEEERPPFYRHFGNRESFGPPDETVRLLNEQIERDAYEWKKDTLRKTDEAKRNEHAKRRDRTRRQFQKRMRQRYEAALLRREPHALKRLREFLTMQPGMAQEFNATWASQQEAWGGEGSMGTQSRTRSPVRPASASTNGLMSAQMSNPPSRPTSAGTNRATNYPLRPSTAQQRPVEAADDDFEGEVIMASTTQVRQRPSSAASTRTGAGGSSVGGRPKVRPKSATNTLYRATAALSNLDGELLNADVTRDELKGFENRMLRLGLDM